MVAFRQDERELVGVLYPNGGKTITDASVGLSPSGQLVMSNSLSPKV